MSKISLQKIEFTNDNKDKKKHSQYDRSYPKQNVDINRILNRVKIDRKNEKKQQIIFYSLTIFTIFLFGSLITIIK